MRKKPSRFREGCYITLLIIVTDDPQAERRETSLARTLGMPYNAAFAARFQTLDDFT